MLILLYLLSELGHPNISRPAGMQLRLEYLRKKNVTWAVEQPSSSLLPLYKPIKAGFGV